MKRYCKYKDSGIEWIGEIPEHWEVNKFGRSAFFQEGPGLRNWQFTESGIKVICVTNIVPPNIDFNVMTKYISYEEYLSSYKHFRVKKGDILLASSGASWGKVAEYLDDEEVILNTSTIRLNETENPILANQFIKWIIQSTYISENLNLLLTGSCQPNFGPTHLNKLFCVYPNSIPEQTTIATYLDRKTAQIDDLISKKEKLIELLKEERTAMINQAVTKGLDNNVPMKDSGIEWLGEIPEGWEVKKLKYFADVVLGKMLTNEDKGNYQLKPYLRAKNIEWYNANIEDVKEMWFSITELEQYRLNKGDLLVSEGGEVGRTCLWKGELNECYIQNSVHKVKLNNDYDNTFFLNQFALYGEMGHFDAIVNRISIAHLTKEKLKEVTFICPPINEQKEISSFILMEEKRIETVISNTFNQIALLKEYKTALISEVVTGKVKVIEE